MKEVQKIYKEKVLKIIIMTVAKLYINRTKSKVIVLLIKQKIKRTCKIINRIECSNLVLDSSVDQIEITMVSLLKEVITDFLVPKDTLQLRTILIIANSNLNNNKKWECLVFMDHTKEDEVDHQNLRRRIKTISNL